LAPGQEEVLDAAPAVLDPTVRPRPIDGSLGKAKRDNSLVVGIHCLDVSFKERGPRGGLGNNEADIARWVSEQGLWARSIPVHGHGKAGEGFGSTKLGLDLGGIHVGGSTHAGSDRRGGFKHTTYCIQNGRNRTLSLGDEDTD
jgi:hypothetical protein